MGAGASSQTSPRYKWEQDTALKGPWTFLFKEKVQCACEGSKWCTRENPTKQKQPNAIAGLHSSWVGDKVLAMARPWEAHVAQYGLVAAFQRAKIGMILNLQELGEHASCGPGNLRHTGFTYDPEPFMAGGIGYYNFAWRDMGVPSLDRMMDIVQVMDYVTRVEGRKIAVHCHAGLGRTGLAIACFFVFSGEYDTPEAAIAAVRKDRPGAVQTRSQVAFVTIFAKYLQHLRCVFPQQGGKARAAGGRSTGGGSPVPPLHSSSSVANISAGGGGAGGASLETRSAPPGGLPKDGLINRKDTGNAVVGVYSSGLTVTVPLQTDGGGGGGAADGGGDGDGGAAGITDADLGLEEHLPWNDTFHIQPQHAADFKPRPPRTYTEALARQARLLHGPERRAFLRLHKLVKEAVFAIIAAANAFQSPVRGPSRPVLALPAILEEAQQQQQQQQPPTPLRTKSSAALAAAAAASANGNGSPHAPQLPPTFAHLLAYIIASHGSNQVDSAALAPLMAHKAYAAAVGSQLDSSAVLAEASELKGEVNQGRYDSMERAPLLLLVMLLEAFFANFGRGGEPTSLTVGCLTAISKSYQDLFNSQMQAPPSRPGTADPAAADPAIAGTPPADPGGSASLEYARQAYEVLEPLEPRDSELLLVFAAMLRVVARGSGPGSEEAVVAVGKWVTGLLLGKIGHIPEAQEAVLSFLWYLAGRDEAYAMLVLLKRQRIAGISPRHGPGGVDVAVMLQQTAASLATAANTPSPPDSERSARAGGGVVPALPPPPPLPGQPMAGTVTSTLVAPMTDGSSTDGGSALSSPGGGGSVLGGGGGAVAVSPHMLPALQLAQLLSQDVQQLYRTSFREAIAGISSVVYPPPVATGRIDVHDVWR